MQSKVAKFHNNTSVQVEHCACDNAGTFCLVVSDKGAVYFGGVNKKGESGESGQWGSGCMWSCVQSRVLHNVEHCHCLRHMLVNVQCTVNVLVHGYMS